jgi:hypothetical protein
MKRLAVVILLFVALGGFLGTGLAFYAGWQMDKLRAVAECTPTPTRLAELLEQSPPANRHVELRSFTCGKPYIEKGADTWNGVWLPLYPDPLPAEASAPAAFFRDARVRNQSQLDDLANQPTLKAIVTNPLPAGSLLKVGPTRELKNAYPGVDMSRAVFLTVPEFRFRGYVLDAGTLFDPRTAETAWAVAAACLLAALVGLVLACWLAEKWKSVARVASYDVDEANHRTQSIKRTRSRIPPAAMPEQELAGKRARLSQESPRSVHRGKALGSIGKLVKWAAGAALGLMFAGVCVGLVLYLLEKGETWAAAFAGLFALLALTFGLVAPVMMAAWWSQRVSRIEVCPSGLRWSRGRKTRQAAWGEILLVQRMESETYQGPIVGMGGLIAAATAMAPRRVLSRSDSLLIELAGDRVRVDAATLTDYVEFAESVQLHHRNETRRLEFGTAGPAGGEDAPVRSSGPQPFIPLGQLRPRV